MRRQLLLPPLALLLAAEVSLFAAAAAAAPYTSFRPGQLWLDTEGSVIRAHSGGLLNDPHSDRTYWYGSEGYPGGDALLNTKINVYSSPDADLMNWRREGVAFDMPQQQGACAAPPPNPKNPMRCYADRCKVLHNRATQKYVMWCKSKPFASVAVAASPVGPFKLVNQFIPAGHEVGDCTAYQDPTDPDTAYFILSIHPGLPSHPGGYGFSHGDERQLKVFQLTDDFQNLTGAYGNATERWPLPNKYDGKLEAPAAFYDATSKQNYMWTSHCTYWFPNDAVLLGSLGSLMPVGGETWERLGNPTHNDTSWQSQSTFVLPVPHVSRSPALSATSSSQNHTGDGTKSSNNDAVYTATDAQWICESQHLCICLFNLVQPSLALNGWLHDSAQLPHAFSCALAADIADRFMCNFDSGTLPGCPNYIDNNQTGRYVWLPIERASAGSKTPLVVKWHAEWKLHK
jgi:hypothetical protein